MTTELEQIAAVLQAIACLIKGYDKELHDYVLDCLERVRGADPMTPTADSLRCLLGPEWWGGMGSMADQILDDGILANRRQVEADNTRYEQLLGTLAKLLTDLGCGGPRINYIRKEYGP